MNDIEEDLGPRLSSADAAVVLGVSEATMSRLRDRGDGPKYQKIGGQIFYYGKWLAEYLRASVVVPTKQGETK